MEPLELLARDDKWSLGCGDGAIFAPAAPLWLDVPGFWDGATIYQAEIAPLFTVTVLDEEGKELTLKLQSRRWTPAELTLEYRLSNGVTATEVRTVHPGGVFISEWRLRALRTARVQMVAWTAQPDGRASALGSDWPGGIRIERPATDADGRSSPLVVELSMTGREIAEQLGRVRRHCRARPAPVGAHAVSRALAGRRDAARAAGSARRDRRNARRGRSPRLHGRRERRVGDVRDARRPRT